MLLCLITPVVALMSMNTTTNVTSAKFSGLIWYNITSLNFGSGAQGLINCTEPPDTIIGITSETSTDLIGQSATYPKTAGNTYSTSLFDIAPLMSFVYRVDSLTPISCTILDIHGTALTLEWTVPQTPLARAVVFHSSVGTGSESTTITFPDLVAAAVIFSLFSRSDWYEITFPSGFTLELISDTDPSPFDFTKILTG